MAACVLAIFTDLYPSALVLSLRGSVKEEHSEKLEVLSIYWHFVDAVWVVVFTVVYVVGR
jgi:cytochrome c oxidase subunit 3/cytochrome o ubiquinol oxidase subunit 3